MDEWFVYILQSLSDGSFYTGISQNIEKRLMDHNNKKSKYTSSRTPWKLVYSEPCKDSESARKREKYFKSAAGRRFIIKFLQNQSDQI